MNAGSGSGDCDVCTEDGYTSTYDASAGTVCSEIVNACTTADGSTCFECDDGVFTESDF